MKKYRLKEEVKKYLHFNETALNQVLTLREWQRDKLISLQALEEVPQRIELSLCNPNDITHRNNCLIRSGCDLTDQEKDLCEKALNGELLDIDSLERNILDFLTWRKSYYVHPINDAKEVKEYIEQYLNEKK